MNTKTIIILLVLAVVAFLLYYFVNKASSQTVTVDEKTTNTTTGLSSVLGGTGTGSTLGTLFGLLGKSSNDAAAERERLSNPRQ